MTGRIDAFQQLRPLMFSIAYRMLGSVGDAEDIVQEAFVRYYKALSDGADIQSTKAFLSAVTTRLSIDQLRSARVRRETYVGQWLPEPLLTDPTAIDPADTAQQADTVSMAFLLVLERLSPVERSVFLLRDVFEYGYGEIAAIVGKSADNCRQLAVRARRRIVDDRPRFETSRGRREELADRFLAAMVDGDLDGLVATLAADVVVVGDSGGASPSWPRPILGADKVSRLLLALAEQVSGLGIAVQRAEVNGQPGAVFRDRAGQLINVFSLEIADGAVQTVRSVINPDKLAHLGPLADLEELQRQRQARRGGTGEGG
jgi:RNA polymerase sigma-70 factor (ECF subfamily)